MSEKKKKIDIFWGTMEYDEVFLQHHASKRHVQDGGDVIPGCPFGLHFSPLGHSSFGGAEASLANTSAGGLVLHIRPF